MRTGQFTKMNLRSKQTKNQSVVQWPLLKYIMQKQQIQQMSSQSEDNGLIIFFKLKHLLFPEIEDDEQIISYIRQDPLKTIDKVLMTITQQYSEKLAEIIQPLEEEKNHLSNKLKQTKQKLQNYMDDNEYFKAIIDRLQQEKKDIQGMLNQSQDEIERSYQQFESINDQKQKIKSEVKVMYQSYQSLLAQNSQLKYINFQMQKELILTKHQIQQLVQANKSYETVYKKIEEEKYHFYQQNCRLRDENEGFSLKINQKQQFIASFISEYNKIHYFQKHHESFNQTEKVALDTSKDSDYNQLKGFNFNQFDKDSIKSEISSKRSSVNAKGKNKSNQKQGEIGLKSLYGNATAEKLKISLLSKITGSEHKNKNQTKVINQKKHSKEIEKNATAKYNFQSIKESKTLSKAESSKNLRKKQSHVTPSEVQGSKMNIEQVLRKRLLEKNAKIGRLQYELNGLRAQYIQQRQNITEMQGNYEIQISELKQELKYLKSEFTTMYRKYALVNSQSVIYQEKVVELQSQLAKIEQEHQFYCEQLKRRCKSYIIKKLDQAEVHYQTIRSYEFSTKKKLQPEKQLESIRNIQKYYTEKCCIEQEYKNVKQTHSLQLHSDYQSQSQEIDKQEELSDIYSYQHVQNHYINGYEFKLELSLTNKNNDRDPLQEIYVRENFQIQSDLGGFTERLISNNVQKSKQKGNLTDRGQKKMLKSMIDLKIKKKFTLDNVFQIDINPKLKNISYCPLQDLTIYPVNKNLQFSSYINETVYPLSKDVKLQNKVLELKYKPSLIVNQIFQEISLMVKPQKLQTTLKLYKTSSLTIFCKQKNEIKLQSNVFAIIQSEKNVIDTYTYFQFNSQNFKEFSRGKQNKIQSCTQTDSQQSFTCMSCKKENTNISLQRVNSSQICNIHFKQSNLIQDQQCKNDQHFDQFETVKNLVQSNISERILIVSRLDQFGGCEIEEKINYQQNIEQKYQHCRYKSIQYEEVVVEYCKKQQLMRLQQIENYKSSDEIRGIQAHKQKMQDFEQQSRIKQNTKASTVQTYAQWYQIDKIQYNLCQVERKQNYVQNSPKSLYEEQTKKVDLNKAMVLSNNNTDKADSQKSSSSFNPECKHNRAFTHAEDFHISPWFFDQKKHLIVNNEIISLDGLPNQLINTMKAQNLAKLGKFLKQNRIMLKFQERFQSRNFKKLEDLYKKLLIIKANKDRVEKTFLLANKFLYCLQDKTKITINKQRFIDQNNFSFGQSEIVISRDKKLKINRNNKRDRLSGNMQDGIWEIDSYMVFEYKSKNNK